MSCTWWGELSEFGRQAVDSGLSTREELSGMAAAFREWAAKPDAFYVLLHGEVLAR